MSAAGKNTISFRKKDLQEQRSIAIGFRKTMWAHKATFGDTGITLSALVTPPEMAAMGFVNPNGADIVASQLFFYQKNLTIISSLRGELMPYLSYTVSSSNRIEFNGFTAADGEIFIGFIDYNAVTGTQVVDAQFTASTGTIAIGTTDFNVGTAFAINANPSQQVGSVLVFRNGQQQFRCIGNNAANEGNYTEVDNGSGLGQIIRFVDAAPGPTEGDSILVVSNGLVQFAPDGSALQVIETLAGQLDSLIPTVAALAGVPESTFQATPNNVDLKTFGDRVLNLENTKQDDLFITYLKDVKASGTDGGTFTAGAYQTRVLNTLEGSGVYVSLLSNQFTILAGTYQIEAYAPCFIVNQHKLRLQNITDATTAILGMTMPNGGTSNIAEAPAVLKGTITITTAKTFELQHRCTTTRATDGFGPAASFGDNEVYSIVKIEKVG